MGIAYGAQIPYAQVILRDHFDPNGMHRLFMRDDQIQSISQKVLGKLSLLPDSQVWENAIVVIGDVFNSSRQCIDARYKSYF